MHRDLKVENILLAGPGFYKLCDFGSTAVPKDAAAQTMHEIQELELELNKHTTLQYRAPEMCDVWSRKGVGLPADIWALGVLLYKLCFYTTPFEEHGPLAILNCQYKMPSYPNYSADIRNIISSILVESAQQRPTAWQVHKEVCRLRGVAPNRDYASVPPRGHSLKVSKCNKADSFGSGMCTAKVALADAALAGRRHQQPAHLRERVALSSQPPSIAAWLDRSVLRHSDGQPVSAVNRGLPGRPRHRHLAHAERAACKRPCRGPACTGQ
jgi:serine/threonine protein kinase